MVTLSQLTLFADIIHSTDLSLAVGAPFLTSFRFMGWLYARKRQDGKGLRKYIHVLLRGSFVCCFIYIPCGCLMSQWLGVWEQITKGKS